MGPDPEARARVSGKVEFLEIWEILPFRVDIAEPISKNSMIPIKQMGRYGYGGPSGPSPDSEVWAQILTQILRLGLGFPEKWNFWKSRKSINSDRL